MGDEGLIEELVAIRASGWTAAEMFLIFYLMRPERSP